MRLRAAAPLGGPRIGRAWVVLAAGGVDLLAWGGNGVTRLGGSASVLVVAGAAAMVLSLRLPVGRWRTAYVFCLLVGMAWASLFAAYQPFAALLVVLYQAVRVLPGRRAAPYVAGTAGQWVVNTASARANLGSDVGGVLTTFTFWTVIAGLVVMAGRYARTQDELHAARAAVAAAQEARAAQDERLRVAREVHDIVSHSVAAVVLQAAGARQVLDDRPRVEAALRGIEASSTAAMAELRTVLATLREPGSGPPAAAAPAPSSERAQEPSIADTIATVAQTTRASGVAVDVRHIGTPTMGRLSPAADVACRRLVQESLTNVMRHQGSGSCAAVELDWTGPDALAIQVRSHTGPRPPRVPVGGASGRGLAGLRQRLEAVGGSLTAAATTDGYVVTAALPWATAPV